MDGVGWSQQVSPAYVAVIGIFQAQHTQTGKMHPLKDVYFLIGIQDLM